MCMACMEFVLERLAATQLALNPVHRLTLTRAQLAAHSATQLMLTVEMHCGAGAVAMQMERDTAYGLTLVWALVAVYGAQASSAVRITALVCIGVNTLLAMFSLLRRKSASDRGSGEIRQPFKSKSDEDGPHTTRQQSV